MAIKLNGVEITSNKLNGQEVVVEKVNSVPVYPYANKWVSTTNTNYEASFEYQMLIIDASYDGCMPTSEHLSNLPSPSSYVVNTIVRIHCNSSMGGTCSTWAYFEAQYTPPQKQWVHTSTENWCPSVSAIYMSGSYGGVTQAQAALQSAYPAVNYSAGDFAEVNDTSTNKCYVFQVQII